MKKLLILMFVLLIFACSEDSDPGILDQEVLKEKPEVVEEESETEQESETETDADTDTDGEDEEQGTVIDVNLPQNWQLYKARCCGNIEEMAEDLEYYHEFVFGEDLRFEKTVIHENDTLKYYGEFQVVETSSQDTLYRLTHDNEIVRESCVSGNLQVLTLTFEDDKPLLFNKLSPCDGPDLYYEEVN